MSPILPAEERLAIVQAAYADQTRSKYGAHRCDCAHKHASRKECARWQELVLLERAGRLRNLRQQVPFVLAEAVVIDGRRKPALRYIADWAYDEFDGIAWVRIVEDCKGVKTPAFQIKRHLLALQGIELRIT